MGAAALPRRRGQRSDELQMADKLIELKRRISHKEGTKGTRNLLVPFVPLCGYPTPANATFFWHGNEEPSLSH